MGFWNQLKLLLWKNYIVRKRQKLRLALEIIWPLLLFLILMWVRTRGLRTFRPECYYDEKALPSAGFLPFVQTFYCTFSNPCQSTTDKQKFDLWNTSNSNLNDFVQEAKNILKKSIHVRDLSSITNVYEDLLTVIPSFILTYLRSESQNLKGNFDLGWISFNDSFGFPNSLKNIRIPLSNLSNIVQIFLSNSNQVTDVLCNKTAFQAKNTNFELSDFKNHLCNMSEAEITTFLYNILQTANADSAFKTLSEIVEANSNDVYSLHTQDWIRVYYILENVMQQLINSGATKDLLENVTVELNANFERMKKSPLKYLNEKVCGRSLTFVEPSQSIEGGLAKLDEMGRKMQVTLVTAPEVELDENTTSKQCYDLFEGFGKSKFGRFVWRQMKPFVLGKILYAPNNTAADMIMSKVNEYFKVIDEFLVLTQQWQDNISPALQSYFIERPETLSFFQNFTNEENIKSNAFYSGIWNRLAQFINAGKNVSKDDGIILARRFHSYFTSNNILITWKNGFAQVDDLVKNINLVIGCIDQDKIQAVASEGDAEAKALELVTSDRLWALVVFDNLKDNITLPPHIIYKIRMDADKVDSTKRIQDRMSRPGARANPFIDLKYFTFGFIYLQDMIENAIINLQTGFDMLPGMWMQQFPYPCYIYDQFILAISRTFPMFMVLSWVYPAAMIIKTVVHEKERRLKEITKVMGLGNGVHLFGWFINSFIVMMVTVSLLTMILKSGDILIRSDVSVIWVFLTLYMCTTINFSFLISTFFSRANISAAAGGIIFFVTYLPYPFLILWEEELVGWEKGIVSVFSNVCFGFGCSYFAQYEEIGVGVQWSNIGQSPILGDSFSMAKCMVIMAIDCLIYGFFALYIEAVFPGQYGVPKPWYKPFGLPNWFHQTKLLVDAEKSEEEMIELQGLNTNSDNHEKEPTNLQLGIRIQNLKKVYTDGKVALDNLNFNFYEDQITSFLGHNGAGKTTTMSILTGLFPPTSGTAFIYGLDVRSQIDKIRKSLGTCPQHNVLFDHLTVEEHLLFYSQLRGKKKSTKELMIELNKMIEDLGLPHKRNELSRNLSGGMQRKLSVAIAFVGGSRTVILDEPTAGVDPYSRRAIWDLLLKYKKGRTILLTTHHMDEADLLGDRIAIVANGKLCCSGSSLFLKCRYATGYYLTLARVDNANENQTKTPESEITSFIKSHIEDARLSEDVGTELVYVLPTSTSGVSAFSDLFDALDRQSLKIGIASYGVSDTTLDEIFLKVTKQNEHSKNVANGIHLHAPTSCLRNKHKIFNSTKIAANDEISSDGVNSDGAIISDNHARSSSKVSGWRLIRKHIVAINIKRFHHTRRDIKALFCEIVLPALFVCMALTFTLILPPMRMEPSLQLHPWLYGPPNYIFFSNENPNDPLALKYENMLVTFPGIGTRCLNEEIIKSKPCHASNVESSWSPYPLQNSDLNRSEDAVCNCDSGIQTCSLDAAGPPFPSKLTANTDILLNATHRNLSSWLIRTNKDYRKRRYGGFTFGFNNPLSNLHLPSVREFTDFLVSTFDYDSLSNVSRKFEKGLRDLPIFNNIKIWFNNQGWASSVSYLNALNNLVLRTHLPIEKESNSFGITIINHPLNFTRHQLEVEVIKRSGISLLHAICIIFAMSFVPASFVLYLIEERASKSKHLQFVTGLRPIVYWISNFIWDSMNYFMSAILCIFIFIIFNEDAYVSSTNFPGLVLLLLLYGWAAIPSMYPAAFVFNVPSTAFVALASTNLFIGIVSTVSTFILELMDDQELQDIANLLKKIFLIFPHYCLGRGLIEMATSHLMLQSLQRFGIEAERNPLSWDFLGINIFCMFLQGIVMFLFTLLIEYNFFKNYFRKQMDNLDLERVLDEEDVGRERDLVLSGRFDYSILKIVNLTKVYNNWKRGRCRNKIGSGRLVAVNRLCFAVGPGECFGLLGVNGAGKTTTFKMLTQDTAITSGDAFINGFSITKQMDQARQHLGYCPQFDALDQLLTAEEHLIYYANIRGIVDDDIRQLVRWQISKMNLVDHAKKCAGKYSGGNKRKLSTAIALVGNPSLIFLDEPTTGMDPQARRFLWNCISELVKEGRSLILTSHSLEECEALCTKLAVMVNGSLSCIGSIQHLKNKFGNGYSLTIRVSGDLQVNLELVKTFIAEKFPQSVVVEEHHNQLVFRLASGSFALASLFKEMESVKDRLQIEHYSVCQTTLDQVFINFAKQQKHLLEEC